jgi:hypothetical protein
LHHSQASGQEEDGIAKVSSGRERRSEVGDGTVEGQGGGRGRRAPHSSKEIAGRKKTSTGKLQLHNFYTFHWRQILEKIT